MGNISQFTTFKTAFPQSRDTLWEVIPTLCCLHENSIGLELFAVNTGGKPGLREM